VPPFPTCQKPPGWTRPPQWCPPIPTCLKRPGWTRPPQGCPLSLLVESLLAGPGLHSGAPIPTCLKPPGWTRPPQGCHPSRKLSVPWEFRSHRARDGQRGSRWLTYTETRTDKESCTVLTVGTFSLMIHNFYKFGRCTCCEDQKVTSGREDNVYNHRFFCKTHVMSL